ncbi:MAG: hypothetical protein ACE37K_02185 [Planctomycetota bacterium]
MGAKKGLLIVVAACALLLVFAADIFSGGERAGGDPATTGSSAAGRDPGDSASVVGAADVLATEGSEPAMADADRTSRAADRPAALDGSNGDKALVDRKVAVEDFLFALGHLFENGPTPLTYAALNAVGIEPKEADLRVVAELVQGFRDQQKQWEFALSNSVDREVENVIASGRVTPKPATRDANGAMRVPISPRGVGPVVTRYNRAGVYHIPMDMLPETQRVKAEMLTLVHDLGCRLATFACSSGYLGEEDCALLVVEILAMGSNN